MNSYIFPGLKKEAQMNFRHEKNSPKWYKMLTIFIISLTLTVSGCKVYKADTGNTIKTKSALHFEKVHPNGFWVGGKYYRHVDSNRVVSR